ncbi:MAG TPA: MFS transporter [Burkholderiaceae bacterium]|nr:MFS transporter [Burkholderiaceae bacterium]
MVTLLISTVGTSGIYVESVVLPAVQAEFGVSRSDASIPYALTMLGFGLGGILMGRVADRFGVMVPVMIGGVSLLAGFVAAAMAGSLWMFAIAHGLLVGLLGSAPNFGPLVADTSLWFERRRGIAVAICASGNYVAGTLWPPLTQHFVELYGWRATYVGIGVLLMRPRPPVAAAAAPGAPVSRASERPFGMTPNRAQVVLSVSAVACCVAMAMPQVHIVAYCADLGYGAARGAQMLSIVLGCGIISRLGFGLISDRIGGLRTLLLGAVLQAVALALFLPFDGLVSLFVISALFGLFQGGIVPSYALVIREYFPAGQAATRVGDVLMFTLFGMALGGWMTGKVFDLTGSYQAAFVNGIGWNFVTVTIATTLLVRARRLYGEPMLRAVPARTPG